MHPPSSKRTARGDPPPLAWLRAQLREGGPPPPPSPTLTDTGWADLARLLTGHGLGALVPESALESAPLSVRKIFATVRRFTLASNIALLSAAERVQRSFRDAGVACVALKGIALIEGGLYRAGERPMSDIDLLVGRDDLERARALLAAAGWRGPSDPERTRALKRHHHWHFALPDTRPGIALDLHWTPASGERRLPTFDQLRLAAGEVPALSWSSQLYFLCINAARHHYANGRLLLVYDLARACSRRAAEIDWAYLAALASRTGTLRQVRLSLTCANTLFGAPLEIPVELGESDRIERALLPRLRDPFRTASRLERRIVRLLGADGWRERARLLAFAAGGE